MNEWMGLLVFIGIFAAMAAALYWVSVKYK